MAKKRKTKTKNKSDAVTPFRNKLWKLFEEQARGVDGAEVVRALKQAGEEIWAVGVDKTYSEMAHQNDESLGNAFDITWLTVVSIKLQAARKTKVQSKS